MSLEALAQRLEWGLLHSLWQAALAWLAVQLVLLAVPNRRASVRYWGAVAGLASVPLAFLATALLGPGRSAVLLSLPRMEAHIARQDVVSPIVIAWSAGVSLTSLRLSVSFGRIRGMRARARGLDQDRWRDLMQRLAGSIGVDRAVGLLESDDVEAPLLIGWLRPVVLLPVGFVTRMSPAEIECILLHELAHVRRHDVLVNHVQAWIETLFFYHPAVWSMSRQIRAERECCCDDRAVAAGQDPVAYAHALAEAEAFRATSMRLGVAAQGGELVTRIRRLLEPRTLPRTSTRNLVASTILTVGAAAATLVFACDPDEPQEAADMSQAEARMKERQLQAQVRAAEYEGIIEEAATRHAVPKELIHAVIEVESHYDPEVESDNGASGLMQIMPETAQKLGVQDPRDPSQNVDGGAKLLRQLADELDGDLARTVAAYNAGVNAVKQHDGVPPVPETQKYVQEVLTVYARRGGDPNALRRE